MLPKVDTTVVLVSPARTLTEPIEWQQSQASGSRIGRGTSEEIKFSTANSLHKNTIHTYCLQGIIHVI